MNLTSEKTLEMLEDLKGKISNDKWIYHSICVGNSAGIIAEKLGLDISKAKTLGYIHDIGRVVGEHSKHDINGYNYLKELGFDDDYANICLTHSYLNNDVNCTAGGFPENIPFRTDFIKNHNYTIYEKIINLCDLMCKGVTMTLEKRLIDLIVRKGVHKNTIYHIQEAYKLKEEIDGLLGENVYNLFPNLINN